MNSPKTDMRVEKKVTLPPIVKKKRPVAPKKANQKASLLNISKDLNSQVSKCGKFHINQNKVKDQSKYFIDTHS